MDYMSTDSGADSSSRFPFRVQTDTQTRLNALPHTGGYTAGVGNNHMHQVQPLPAQTLLLLSQK